MCTSIAMNTEDFYFGRTMDIEYSFGENIVFTPRNFSLSFRRNDTLHRHYAMLGMASVRDGYPLYAEAVNERGLCIAGLNFPDSAYYPPKEDPIKQNVSPFELIPWLCAKCASVTDVKQLLAATHLVDIPFSDSLPSAPLHWHIADRQCSIVLESTGNELEIYDNPVGVLTNNP